MRKNNSDGSAVEGTAALIVGGLAVSGALWYVGSRMHPSPKRGDGRKVKGKRTEASLSVELPISEVRAFLGGATKQGFNKWQFTAEQKEGSKRTRILAVAKDGAFCEKDAVAALRKVKALMETGETATIEGQTHGRRSLLGLVIGEVKHVAHLAVDAKPVRIAHPGQTRVPATPQEVHA